MVTKKKSIENTDNLYICMYNSQSKRKNILHTIKDALIMQEEYNSISNLREDKKEVLNQIKKNLNDINNDYQKLKKLLPNVKNVISYTEKELTDLESQVDRLKGNVKSDNDSLKETKEISKTLKKTIPKEELTDEAVKKAVESEIKKSDEKKMVKTTSKKPLTKLDRIKNNLSVIESKLNKL